MLGLGPFRGLHPGLLPPNAPMYAQDKTIYTHIVPFKCFLFTDKNSRPGLYALRRTIFIRSPESSRHAGALSAPNDFFRYFLIMFRHRSSPILDRGTQDRLYRWQQTSAPAVFSHAAWKTALLVLSALVDDRTFFLE